MERHIDTWKLDWSGQGCDRIIGRLEMGTLEFVHRVQYCFPSCYHSYVYDTPPHADGDCERYRPGPLVTVDMR